MLPSDRYARAGASEREIAELEAEYDGLSAAQQQLREQHLATLSDLGLVEELDARRARAEQPKQDALAAAPAPDSKPSTPPADASAAKE